MLKTRFFSVETVLVFLIYALLLTSCQVEQRKNNLGVDVLPIQDERHGGPGALITGIYPCTAAEDAKLQLGDVIQKVGNRRTDGNDLQKIIDDLPLHANVTLGVKRGETSLRLSTRLQTSNTQVRAREVPYSGLGSWAADKLPLVVRCVEPGSPLATSGVMAGDTIDSINGQFVNSATFEDVLATFELGTQIPLGITRGDKTFATNVLISDYKAAPKRMVIGEINDISTRIGDVVEVEALRLDNCYGSAVIERVRSITRKSSSHFDLSVGADFKTFGVLPFLLAENKVSARLETGMASELSETKSEVLRAEPGTISNYRVKWYRVSTTGTVTINADGRSQQVPFVLSNRLRSEVESLPATPCGSFPAHG